MRLQPCSSCRMEFKSLLKVLRQHQAKKKSELEKIAFAIGAISGLMGGKDAPKAKATRRKMSAAARKKISAAMKARWAKKQSGKV